MDRRVARTQAALEQALIALILEQGFEVTTVAQIAERANVGRSTFYAHYADKEDLFQGALGRLRELLSAEAAHDAIRGVHPAVAFALPMLEHAAHMRPLFEALAGRRGGELLRDLAHDVWADTIRARWAGADEVAVQAIAGAFGAVVTWWLTSAPELEPAEVDRRFRAAIEPTLGAVS